MLFRGVLFFFFFFCQFYYAQLSNFTFHVTSTNETCQGNGSLNFAVSNTVSGATFTYAVFLLPNTTTPIAVTNNTALTGLNSGTYQVTATQTLGPDSGSQQQNITITNAIQNMAYTISGVRPICGNNGVLTVNVNSGNPATYQIITGPVTTDVQSSNVFNNLPPGQYQIIATDVCGNTMVQTYTLLPSTPGLTLNFGTVVQPLLSCNTINVSNYFSSSLGNVIAYPLHFQYTVFPPGGGTPTILNQTVNGGNAVDQAIPFYNAQQYYYNLVATDACGNVYTLNNNPVNRKFDATIIVNKLDCSNKQIEISPSFFIAPYTVNFISYPAGFNPLNYNSSHPGPFSSSSAIYGAIGNSIPLGGYTISITDSCGRTVTKTISVTDNDAIPTYSASKDGCAKLMITLSGVLMQSISITSAPAGFPISLPYDVTSYINPTTHNLEMAGLMEGNYVFKIIDICGVEYTLNVIIPPYTPNPLTFTQRTGCDEGFGSVKVVSDIDVNIAVLISAPANYTGTLPQNLSIISGNSFFLSNVPQGNYIIQSVNTCGAQRIDVVSVTGYAQNEPNVVIQRNCGSFNIAFDMLSNNASPESYWIQKFDLASGNWKHPQTGVFYVNGTVPNSLNAFSLQPVINNLNLAFSGQFRILKNFKTYNSDGTFFDCVKEIYSFEILAGPSIISIPTFGCSNGNSEAIVNAIGIPPLIYRITTKNGAPFLINNGTSNSFSNLSPGIYNFQVEDSCGNIVNAIIEITNLAPMQITATSFCSGQNGTFSVPNFPFFTYEWWKDNATTTILSTSNSLSFTPFTSPTDYGVYYVRITNTLNPSSCLNRVLSFTLSDALNNPHAGNDNTINLCTNQSLLNLQSYLSGTFDTNGVWTELTNSGGALVGANWNATNVAYGSYQFSYRVNGFCSNFDEAIITINLGQKPIITNLNPVVQLCNGQNLYITANQNNSSYSYQWTGPNSFSSTLPDLEILSMQVDQSGIYTLVISNGSCISDPFEVSVIVSPVPEFYINALCVNNYKTLQVIPLNDSFNPSHVNYIWTGPNGFISNMNPIQISNESVGLYSVVVQDVTCSTNDQIMVTSLACSIPKGISPNGDNSNDYFDLSAFEVENLKIFNRYGREVFSEFDYKKEWYGQDFKGSLLPAGTYYYVVVLKSGESKTGWVYLQR